MKRADWHEEMVCRTQPYQVFCKDPLDSIDKAYEVYKYLRMTSAMLDKFVEMAEWYEDGMKWDDSVGNLSDKARQVLEAYEKGEV